MMNALKEYNEMVWKPAWRWAKKHWKGFSVFMVISMIGPYIWWYWSEIRTFIKSKFQKKDEKES